MAELKSRARAAAPGEGGSELGRAASKRRKGRRSDADGDGGDGWLTVLTVVVLLVGGIMVADHLMEGAVLDPLRERFPALRPEIPAFDVRRVDRSIDRATRYLCGAADDTGKFAYEVLVKDGEAMANDDYNVLRHAGAIYALADSCYFSAPQAGVRDKYCGCAADAIRDTVQWLVRETLWPIPNLGMRGIYKPHGDPTNPPLKANGMPYPKNRYRLTLGGQGLAMMAMSMANQAQPGLVEWDTIEEIGTLVTKHFQQEDGTFYSFWYAHSPTPSLSPSPVR